MNLKNILKILDGKILTPELNIDRIEIPFVGAADLMSDILALTNKTMLLVTGLTAVQTVRTAEMSGNVSAIVFVRGKQPDEMTVEIALENEIPLVSTHYTMYETCGLLYKNNLPPVPLIAR